MGKKNFRQEKHCFTKSFESLTKDYKFANQLRYDLWLTTRKQQKIIKLLKTLTPDANNSDARNTLHEFTKRSSDIVADLESLIEDKLVTTDKPLPSLLLAVFVCLKSIHKDNWNAENTNPTKFGP